MSACAKSERPDERLREEPGAPMNRPTRGAETVRHFDALYESSPDPWSVHSSWYERRKASVVLACLPHERYDLAWEPGCSIGGLTAQLARRCGRVVASDASPRALAVARTALAPLGHVQVIEQLLPQDRPPIADGAADLVVLGEFLYYLPVEEIPAVLDLAGRLQRPGGHLVVMHWRSRPADAWQSGEQVNAQVMADSRWELVVHHLDEGFVLDIGVRR